MSKYSQFEEQDHILRTFAGLDSPGRFLDIGSWDPITFSNTRALVEMGWSGVMIEPSPGPFLEILRCCTKCGSGVDEREHERYGGTQAKGMREVWRNALRIRSSVHADSCGGGTRIRLRDNLSYGRRAVNERRKEP